MSKKDDEWLAANKRENERLADAPHRRERERLAWIVFAAQAQDSSSDAAKTADELLDEYRKRWEQD